MTSSTNSNGKHMSTSNYSSIHIDHDDFLLDPSFTDYVVKVAMAKPEWILRQQKVDKDNSHWYHHGSPLVGQRPDSETRKYLRALDVIENDEKLGEIGVTRVYHRAHSTEYTTTSWRIQKTRGSRETKNTTKLDVALRNCKKFLVSKKLDEWLKVETPDVEVGYRRALSDLRNPICYGHLVKDHSTLQQYMYCIANDKPIPQALADKVLPQLRKPAYEKAMAEFELANYMEDKKTLVVIRVGNYYLFEDEFKVIVKLSFEQLPISMQEKLAVLQLMESGEVVRDVGYRHHKGGNFLITI